MAYIAQTTAAEPAKSIPSSSLVSRLPFRSPPRSLSLPPCRRPVKPLAALPDADNGAGFSRRDLLLLPPLLTVGTSALLSSAAWAEENPSSISSPVVEKEKRVEEKRVEEKKVEEKKVEEKRERKEEASARIYDATVIGEPQAVGKDTNKVWEKLLGARIVYLGEAELVPDRDDRSLELEIVGSLRDKCFEQQRPISLALEIFPSDQQEKLNLFMSKRIDGESLRFFNPQWPPQLWKEYEPLLNYCRDHGVRLVACGTPLEVLRTVQAEGLRGLSKDKRKIYAPPVGSGFPSVFDSSSGRPLFDKFSSYQSVPFAPYSYLSAQTRAVDDYAMSKVILKAMNDGGSLGMLVVVTGASHVVYGSRGIGVPARISKKMQKKYQSVVLLDPERQQIRHEGEAPVADFLWYSAAKPCTRNCFDRAEIARVMNAAVRRRDALPKDLQAGLDLGLVSPDMLQNFFDLEKYPYISDLINRFQGFRERLLVDPQFLQRIALEETISITTTLIAQYKKRKECFFEEIDYVVTDVIRVSVVDFFSVWLPAPTLSFISSGNSSAAPENIEVIKGFLGSIPDNAFQKATAGKSWDLSQRFASALIGGMKLGGVGFVASLGTVASSNIISGLRNSLKSTSSSSKQNKGIPLLKSAVVYSFFLGTSANLRYQVIAGIVEHRIADQLLSYYNLPILVTALSFVSRTINCYWGAQQWVDLARFTGVQPRKGVDPSNQLSDVSDASLAPGNQTNVVEDLNNPSGDSLHEIASTEDQRLCNDDTS